MSEHIENTESTKDSTVDIEEATVDTEDTTVGTEQAEGTESANVDAEDTKATDVDTELADEVIEGIDDSGQTDVDTEDDDEPVNEVFLDEGSYVDEDVIVEGGYMRWRVDNFYKPNGNGRKALSMMSDPPLLTLDDGMGGVATIVLTKEFTNDLVSVLTDVKRGYFNAPTMRPHELVPDDRSELQRAKDWVSKNPVKFSVGLLFFVALLYPLIAQMF